jgi:hypothetical protein
VRVSVGLETVKDVIADLEQALQILDLGLTILHCRFGDNIYNLLSTFT